MKDCRGGRKIVMSCQDGGFDLARQKHVAVIDQLQWYVRTALKVTLLQVEVGTSFGRNNKMNWLRLGQGWRRSPVATPRLCSMLTTGGFERATPGYATAHRAFINQA